MCWGERHKVRKGLCGLRAAPQSGARPPSPFPQPNGVGEAQGCEKGKQSPLVPLPSCHLTSWSLFPSLCMGITVHTSEIVLRTKLLSVQSRVGAWRPGTHVCSLFSLSVWLFWFMVNL